MEEAQDKNTPESTNNLDYLESARAESSREDSVREVVGTASLADAISELVADLKNELVSVTYAATDVTEEKSGSTEGISHAADIGNELLLEASAEESTRGLLLSTTSAAMSASRTLRRCLCAQGELSNIATGSQATGATDPLVGECAQELKTASNRLEKFEKFFWGLSSATNSVLRTYEHAIKGNTFEGAALQFKEKLLCSCKIEFASREGSPVKLGSGAFGEVFLGHLVSDYRLVAVKALRINRTDRLSVLHEAFIMQLASSSEYAAQYYGLTPMFQIGTRYWGLGLVCEFIGDEQSFEPRSFYDAFLTDLQSKLVIDRAIQLKWLNVCLKMAKAVSAFHDTGFLLNDIKEENILLRHGGQGSLEPVFIDFGLASVGEHVTVEIDRDNQTKEELRDKYMHIAPEVLFGGFVSINSDIYSIGRILKKISRLLMIPSLQALAEQCLDTEPLCRPTWNFIVETIIVTKNDLEHQCVVADY